MKKSKLKRWYNSLHLFIGSENKVWSIIIVWVDYNNP